MVAHRQNRRHRTDEEAMRARQDADRRRAANRRRRARNPPVHRRRNDQPTNPEQVAKRIKLDDFSRAVSFNFFL